MGGFFPTPNSYQTTKRINDNKSIGKQWFFCTLNLFPRVKSGKPRWDRVAAFAGTEQLLSFSHATVNGR